MVYKDVKLITESGEIVIVDVGTEQEFLVTYGIGGGARKTEKLFYMNRPVSWDEDGTIDACCLEWSYSDESGEEASMFGWYSQSHHPDFERFYEAVDISTKDMIGIVKV